MSNLTAHLGSPKIWPKIVQKHFLDHFGSIWVQPHMTFLHSYCLLLIVRRGFFSLFWALRWIFHSFVASHFKMSCGELNTKLQHFLEIATFLATFDSSSKTHLNTTEANFYWTELFTKLPDTLTSTNTWDFLWPNCVETARGKLTFAMSCFFLFQWKEITERSVD